MVPQRVALCLLLACVDAHTLAGSPSSCLNVEDPEGAKAAGKAGDRQCFKGDGIGMVCGWDKTPQQAYCEMSAEGLKVCARKKEGGRCDEGDRTPHTTKQDDKELSQDEDAGSLQQDHHDEDHEEHDEEDEESGEQKEGSLVEEEEEEEEEDDEEDEDEDGDEDEDEGEEDANDPDDSDSGSESNSTSDDEMTDSDGSDDLRGRKHRGKSVTGKKRVRRRKDQSGKRNRRNKNRKRKTSSSSGGDGGGSSGDGGGGSSSGKVSGSSSGTRRRRRRKQGGKGRKRRRKSGSNMASGRGGSRGGGRGGSRGPPGKRGKRGKRGRRGKPGPPGPPGKGRSRKHNSLKATHDKYGVPYYGWKDGDAIVPYDTAKKNRQKRRRRRRGALSETHNTSTHNSSFLQMGEDEDEDEEDDDEESYDDEDEYESPTESPQANAMLESKIQQNVVPDVMGQQGASPEALLRGKPMEETPTSMPSVNKAAIAAAAAAVGARSASVLPNANLGLPMDWSQFPRSMTPQQQGSLLDTSYEVGSSGRSTPALMRGRDDAEGEQ